MPETMTAPPTKRKVEETEQDDDPRRVKLDDPQSVKENTQKSKPKIQAIPRKMRGRIRKAYEKGGRKVSKRGGEDVAEESSDSLLIMMMNKDLTAEITLRRVQHIIKYIMMDAEPPNWMLCINHTSIKKIVLLMMPGLKPIEFKNDAMKLKEAEQWPDHYTNLKQIFFEAVPLLGPGHAKTLESATDEMLLKGAEIKEQLKLEKKTMIEYAISLEELNAAQTLDMQISPEYYALMLGPTLSASAYQVLAMDCEMCRCTDGSQITHITVVDEDKNIVYNSYVLPKEPIIDYLTEYSGITKETLKGVTTTLHDVQKQLQQLIGTETILIGHGLHNDLRQLKFNHNLIVDTSFIFDSSRGRPYTPALRYLAKKYLHRNIQGADSGHAPFEDACAALDLVNLKLQNYSTFGLKSLSHHTLCKSLLLAGKTSAIIDNRTTIARYTEVGVDTLVCESDQQVCKGIATLHKDHDFVYARIRGIDGFYQQTKTNVQAGTKLDASVFDMEYVRYARQMDDNVGQIWENLEPGTLLMCVSSQGDTMKATLLLDKKKESKANNTDDWTPANEKELAAAVDRARQNIGFFAVRI